MRERGLELPPGLLQGAFGVLAEAKRHEALLGYVDAMGTEAILEGGGPAVNVAVKVFAKAGELDRAIEVVEAAIKASFAPFTRYRKTSTVPEFHVKSFLLSDYFLKRDKDLVSTNIHVVHRECESVSSIKDAA